MQNSLNFLRLFLLLSFALTACTSAPAPTGVDVHIIIGQSNSTGKGHASELPQELQQPLDSCFIYNRASGRFEVIKAGANTQSESGYFGPVLKAAQLLRDHKRQAVYFVVAGVGGTQLFNSGSSAVKDWHPDSHELLTEAQNTIEKARLALVAEGKQPKFKTITWWQGEHDAQHKEMAHAYQINEDALFRTLDQVAYLRNTKRVVFSIFEDVGSLPRAGEVNEAKRKRAASDSRTIAVIPTNNYNRIAQDRLHANAKGQLQAGTDLFNAVRNVK